MPSPFPGMDPYLEHPRAWPNIHHRLITAIADDLAPKLLPKYQVLVEERVYQVDGQDSILVGAPDVSVGQRQRVQVTGAVATAPRPTDGVTVTLNIPETVRQGHLEIREIATSQVITAVEVLSPTNKRPGRGRLEYETKRATVLSSPCSLVEIDCCGSGRRWRLPRRPSLRPIGFWSALKSYAPRQRGMALIWRMRFPVLSCLCNGGMRYPWWI